MADIRRNQGRLQDGHERSKTVTQSGEMKELREEMQTDINAVGAGCCLSLLIFIICGGVGAVGGPAGGDADGHQRGGRQLLLISIPCCVGVVTAVFHHVLWHGGQWVSLWGKRDVRQVWRVAVLDHQGVTQVPLPPFSFPAARSASAQT